MITGSLSLPFSFFPARQLFTCLSLLRLPHSFASFPLPESMEKATLSQSAEYGKCVQNFFYNIHCAHQNCSIACGNCKTKRHDAIQEYSSLLVYSVFKATLQWKGERHIPVLFSLTYIGRQADDLTIKLFKIQDKLRAAWHYWSEKRAPY